MLGVSGQIYPVFFISRFRPFYIWYPAIFISGIRPFLYLISGFLYLDSGLSFIQYPAFFISGIRPFYIQYPAFIFLVSCFFISGTRFFLPGIWPFYILYPVFFISGIRFFYIRPDTRYLEEHVAWSFKNKRPEPQKITMKNYCNLMMWSA